MTKYSASKLRENIYQILDQIIVTGKAICIDRKGVLLTIMPSQVKGRLEGLKKRKITKGNSEDIVHLDWSKEWKTKSF